MRGIRMRRDLTIGTSNSHPVTLIHPKMENLSIGPIPSDSTNVVIAGSNDLGITDKLNALLDEYKPEMVRLSSTGICASSITAKVPREFIQSLYDMLNVNNNGCLQETQTFLQMLMSYLQSSNDGYINIPRNFWKQIGRVFNELNVNESKINMYAAAMRSMSMAITTDAQSLPSNNLLVSTLESISELSQNQTPPIDRDFQANYPELILPQPEPNELMTEVVTQIPTTIGEGSANPPTNMVDITASDASDNIQIHDLDNSSNIESQAYTGLKDLFSVKTLCVPISQLQIVHNNKVKVMAPQTLNYIKHVELVYQDGNYTLDATPGTTTVYSETEIDVSMLDLSKSLLEQDWLVSKQSLSRNSDELTWISTTELVNTPMVRSFDGDFKYRGLNSRREFTLTEARSIGSALTGLWNKVTSMKLPSPQHIQAGTAILAAGLGAAGSLFGSSGLVSASKVVSSINEGLGVFLANLQPSNGLKPEPRASIAKNALAVVPSAIDAGKSVFEGVTVNAQQQRIHLNGIKKEVETAYIMPSTEITLRSRARRLNNAFY
ncbi:VP7 [Bercke-Baary Melophagus reo-like virus]|nr:VP7 [Bercke-Baary Melophagus reo-like virus]UJG27951.1 VP7 [Bercke-Baary Melophagus reo-like virus]